MNKAAGLERGTSAPNSAVHRLRAVCKKGVSELTCTCKLHATPEAPTQDLSANVTQGGGESSIKADLQALLPGPLFQEMPQLLGRSRLFDQLEQQVVLFGGQLRREGHLNGAVARQ